MSYNHSHIELHQDIIAIRKAIEEAKHNLESLVHLHYRMNEVDKQILHDMYDRHFKHLEIDIQKKALLHSELQRRAELLMIKYQRGEKLTPELIALIHKVVDKEFAAIKARMKNLFEQEAKKSKQIHVKSDHASLSKLYKELAKKLHPDSGAQPELTQMYWLSVQQAYESKDLHGLHALHTLICTDTHLHSIQDESLNYDDLQNELKKIEELISKEQHSIDILKKQIPFCYELGLRDESWIQQHGETLNQQVIHFDREIKKANETIRLLTGNNWLLEQEVLDSHDSSLKERREYNEEFIDATYFSGRH
ncbi:MAG: hypothetical protein ACK5F4_03450 [Ignavibacteria bacterium]|jgi:hypothetical protein